MSRWRTLKENTSGGDRLKLGLLSLIFILLAAVAVVRPEARLIFLAVLVCFWLPWVVRNSLVEHCGLVLNGLNFFGFGLLGLSLTKDLWYRYLPDQHEMTLAIGVFAALGLYLGIYFWLLSDPRIGRRD